MTDKLQDVDQCLYCGARPGEHHQLQLLTGPRPGGLCPDRDHPIEKVER